MLASDMLDLATANAFSGKVLPAILVGPWNGMVELGYFMALVGCVSALTRRVVFTPEKLKENLSLRETSFYCLFSLLLLLLSW